ncbi:MAG: hypothetical protein HC875_31125 [Anaerolineales bacterium]|nr:hypothetical protein [Anaerolineales bacterium]
MYSSYWRGHATACTSSTLTATQPVVAAQSPPSRPRLPAGCLAEVPAAPTISPETPTPAPTNTPEPTPSPTPTLPPTPTPAPSLRQLTTGGCCVQPVFSPDSRQVLFIDKPDPAAPVGIYGVDIASPQPAPVLVNPTIGFWNSERTIVAAPAGEEVRFTDQVSGESWTVNTGGNWPTFSPDSSQIVWVATDREGPYDRRQSDVWLANLDGSNARIILTLYGGGLTGWLPDNQRILLTGRNDPNEEKQTLFVYDLVNERRTNLFSHKRLRGGEISTGGSWVAFFISFADEPAENGLWLVSTDGTSQRQLDLPGFGAYAWRNDDTLLYIPMRAPDETSMRIWSVDAISHQLQPLTDPAELPFSISNGDWEISPDSRQVVFVSSTDQNIWLITLP